MLARLDFERHSVFLPSLRDPSHNDAHVTFSSRSRTDIVVYDLRLGLSISGFRRSGTESERKRVLVVLVLASSPSAKCLKKGRQFLKFDDQT